MGLASPAVAWWVAQGWGRPLRAEGLWPLAWALVGSPWLEETIYRLAVQRPLMQCLPAAWAAHGANAGACLCFVLVHMPAQGVGALAWSVPGLLLGELFRQTDRVWPCVLLHAGFNLCLWTSSAGWF